MPDDITPVKSHWAVEKFPTPEFWYNPRLAERFSKARKKKITAETKKIEGELEGMRQVHGSGEEHVQPQKNLKKEKRVRPGKRSRMRRQGPKNVTQK